MKAPIPEPRRDTCRPGLHTVRAPRPLVLTVLAVLHGLVYLSFWALAQRGVDVATITPSSLAASMAGPLMLCMLAFLVWRGFEWARILHTVWSVMLTVSAVLILVLDDFEMTEAVVDARLDTSRLWVNLPLSVVWLIYLQSHEVRAFTQGERAKNQSDNGQRTGETGQSSP